MKVFRDRIETDSGIYMLSSIDGVEWMRAPTDVVAAVDDLRHSIGFAALGAALTNAPAWWFLAAVLSTSVSRALRKGGLFLLVRGQRVKIATGNQAMMSGMARAVLAALQSGGRPG